MKPLSLAAWTTALFLASVLFPHTAALRFLLLLAGAALVIAAIVRDTASMRAIPPLWLAFALWAAWALLSVLWSLEPERSAKEFRNEIVYAALAFWVCYAAAQAPNAARVILPVVGAAAALVSAFALFYYPQGLERYAEGWHGGPGNFSSAALTLMPCVLMAGWYAGRRRASGLRSIALLLAMLLLVAAYTTLNRTLWIGVTAQLLVMGGLIALRRRRSAHWRTARTGVVVALGIIAAGALITAHIQAERQRHLVDTQTFEKDPRLALWPKVMERIEERPLTGFGFGRGMFRQSLSAEFNDPLLWHAHNLFLDVLLQTGVPGLLLLLALLGATVRQGWHLARDSDDTAAACGIALFAVVAGMVVRNMTDTLWIRQNALFYWGVVGVLLAWGTQYRTPARKLSAMRILVIRRDNIGDLVCTTPLFAALRARYPDAHIAALVNSYNAQVLDGNPHVDAVHSYTKLKHRRPGESRLAILLARLRMLARLRREPFDYVVLAKAGFDRQGLSLARQLRRRHVVGFTEPGVPAPRAITLPVEGPPDARLHEVEVVQRLAQPMNVDVANGPLRVYPDPARMEAWRTRLPALAEPGRVWIAVHISARQASRHLPVVHWVELIKRLTSFENIGVVLLWAPGPPDDPRHPGDDDKAAAILDEASALPAPTAELADLIAILALCDAFIGADGGAMHLAAALGLPIVALFEDIEAKKHRWHPWGVPYELVAPDTGDTVEQLLEAWQRLVQRVPSLTSLGGAARVLGYPAA